MAKKQRRQSAREAYIYRARSLRAIGVASYKKYRAGDLWRKIRARILQQHPECEVCGRPAVQVHHAKYSIPVLRGENLRPLYAVCRGCHFKAEFTGNGVKRSPRAATDRMHSMARDNGRRLHSHRGLNHPFSYHAKKAEKRAISKFEIEEGKRNAEATLADYRARQKSFKRRRGGVTPL